MAVWYQLPTDMPTPAQSCYVRVRYYYSAPFIAVWDAVTQTFVSTDNSIVYPAYSIARWKPVT
jgi:hypothetical protein